MNLNATPSANRVHIGIFGRRNAGKSSLINAITGQNSSIVSEVQGTTTDPVLKSMELLPLGPVVMIDTPGLDDQGELGALRIQKTYQILNKTDIALLIIDASTGMLPEDHTILKQIQAKNIPYLIVKNKADLCSKKCCSDDSCSNDRINDDTQQYNAGPDNNHSENDPGKICLAQESESSDDLRTIPREIPTIAVSALTGENIHELKEFIATLAPKADKTRRIIGDLIQPSDFIILVTPIDSAAPKGRLILPQQQTIRDILDTDATAIVVKETNLKQTLAALGKKPSLVVTDSQVFEQVSSIVPKEIPLTSFSILFARYKGNLKTVVNGARAIAQLKENDQILISEGCTHHRQCEDIGTVKLPRWITEYTGKTFRFAFTSGGEFPEDLSEYQLIIHCGGCMLNEREIQYRMRCAEDAGIPITNYGIAIAYIHGILERSIEIFPEL
ncbi:MAG: [FeFe] hydrogenase H-cluster maturation GTPase HydF [Hespellia sp.]|nr:[FeFe] hydrogenase H-cluster maturation GTPase HydF [Hespellia sp.]